MARARPFPDVESLAVTADVIWEALDPDDWREAFAAHPRIGEAPVQKWELQEQAGAGNVDASVRQRLAERNRDYEARFGYIFIVCATGRSASEMLALLEGRLSNDSARELPIAAEQQRQITHVRLAKLLDG